MYCFHLRWCILLADHDRCAQHYTFPCWRQVTIASTIPITYSEHCNKSLSLVSLISVRIFVSSANINILLLTQSDKSLTNIKNNSGPNTDPCGTPLITSIQLEKLPFTWTRICLRNTNCSIRFVSTSPSLSPFNFCTSFWWGTVSKAFL